MNNSLGNFFKRNTLLEAPEGNTITGVTLLGRIKGVIKGEVNALLSKDEVINGYYYSSKQGGVIKEFEPGKIIFSDKKLITDDFISENIYNLIHEKDKVVKRNLRKFKQEIIDKGKISNKDLLNGYINQGYIDYENIRILLFEYLIKKGKEILNKAKEPLYGRSRGGNKIRIKSYHDLDHDLLDIDKNILAYMIVNGGFNDSEIQEIIGLLSRGGDDLEYFLEENYDELFVNNYIKKYII